MDESYTDLLRRELARLKDLAERALAQVSDEQFFTAPGAEGNSLATLVKHMAGNMRSRWTDFLTTDGEKPNRNRDMEFVLTAEDTRPALMERWEASWQLLFAAIQPLSEEDFARTVTIRGEPLTVLQAVNRQLTHYAYHVGQIVYLAKYYAGPRWESLSVPKGQSEEFNQNPESYLP